RHPDHQASTSVETGGRPGYDRFFEPSNFWAMSFRYQARIVSGLATQATSRSTLRPDAFRSQPRSPARGWRAAIARATWPSGSDSLPQDIRFEAKAPGSPSQSHRPEVVAICGSSCCPSILTYFAGVDLNFLPYGLSKNFPELLNGSFCSRMFGHIE